MWRSLIIVLILLALVPAGAAVAHERIEVGDYALVLGWLDEPPLVGLKNAAIVEISRIGDDSPVEDAEFSLVVQIEYGGQTRDLVLRPLEEQPGVYAADFIPTRRGTYTLKVSGDLNGQAIDISNDLEEVESASGAEFPEAQPSPADLQQSIDRLSDEVGTARAFGVAGAALGTIGLVLAGVALRARRA